MKGLLSQYANRFLSAAALTIWLGVTVTASQASQVGSIFACYTCSNTNNPAVNAALASNPGVAIDGLLFALQNTGSAGITGGVFSIAGNDSFFLPTIASGATYILIPGITTDGHAHPATGLFFPSMIMDTSDGDGNVTDGSLFLFGGLSGGQAVFASTAGTSTAVPKTFTAGDPGLIKPFVDFPGNGLTSFLGLGPSGDAGCNNCYFGLVATLNTPAVSGVPEPSSFALVIPAAAIALWVRRRSLSAV